MAHYQAQLAFLAMAAQKFTKSLFSCEISVGFNSLSACEISWQLVLSGIPALDVHMIKLLQ